MTLFLRQKKLFQIVFGVKTKPHSQCCPVSYEEILKEIFSHSAVIYPDNLEWSLSCVFKLHFKINEIGSLLYGWRRSPALWIISYALNSVALTPSCCGESLSCQQI